ncbi:unnamed protein product [Gadus morhua 'NCC']
MMGHGVMITYDDVCLPQWGGGAGPSEAPSGSTAAPRGPPHDPRLSAGLTAASGASVRPVLPGPGPPEVMWVVVVVVVVVVEVVVEVVWEVVVVVVVVVVEVVVVEVVEVVEVVVVEEVVVVGGGVVVVVVVVVVVEVVEVVVVVVVVEVVWEVVVVEVVVVVVVVEVVWWCVVVVVVVVEVVVVVVVVVEQLKHTSGAPIKTQGPVQLQVPAVTLGVDAQSGSLYLQQTALIKPVYQPPVASCCLALLPGRPTPQDAAGPSQGTGRLEEAFVPITEDSDAGRYAARWGQGAMTCLMLVWW